MNLVIFGATGMVGKQLVKQALFNGHHVKAFGRNVFTEGLPKSDELELIQGALFDAGQVHDAVSGADAVLSVLGGATNGADVTRSLGMKNIVEQMQKAGVKRIVALGGMGTLDNEEGELIMENPTFPKQFLAVSKEHYKAYEFLKASLLDWTFVCPPDIIDADPTGIIHTKADYAPEPNNMRITSGDLALFMLKEAQANAFVHHRVGISN